MVHSFGKDFKKEFPFEKNYIPINHGSFGSYPTSLTSLIQETKKRIEENPDLVCRLELPSLLKENLKPISQLIHCDVEDISFSLNASTAMNSILRSYPFQKGDKILCYQTAYAAVDKTIDFLTNYLKVERVTIPLNYPMEDSDVIALTKEAIENEQKKGGGQIRMCVFDAISSIPGVRFPFEKVNELVHEYGILSLVDGAHTIGHIPLNMHELDADFFVSNCHKWLYTPRGCAILYVAKRHQGMVHPTSINYAYQHHEDPSDGSSFTQEHSPGTIDYTPYVCVSAAINYRKSIGGEEAIQKYIHDLAVKGGELVAKILNTRVMENSTKTLTLGMVNVELPIPPTSKSDSEISNHFMQRSLYGYNTMFVTYKHNNVWWVRLCGQIYLDLDDFEKSAYSLLAIIKELEEK
ncbi:pyridoxal phosphate-dependent transferase [Pilobolus umbonatus]|nr:pyridoxal phosphate-dependent transferase [Pilobolus umbonatus]